MSTTVEWPPVQLEAGPVIVDTASRFVYVNGTLRPELTKKEYAVLVELVRAGAHTVCTKQDLTSRVWGPSHVGSGTRGCALLDGVCCRLRKKLGADLIHNVWGVGYRLTMPGANE